MCLEYTLPLWRIELALGQPRSGGSVKMLDSLIGRTTSNLLKLDLVTGINDHRTVSSVEEIESALTRLSLEDLQAVRDWLDDLIEDQLEVSEEFKNKIRRAKEEIADGVYSRTRRPDSGH